MYLGGKRADCVLWRWVSGVEREREGGGEWNEWNEWIDWIGLDGRSIYCRSRAHVGLEAPLALMRRGVLLLRSLCVCVGEVESGSK